MAKYYHTKTGDMLDNICWQYYVKEINLGTAAMAVDPGLLTEPQLLENGFLLGPGSDLIIPGTVERVLQANPGLADYPLSLPAGLSILLPDLETSVEQDTSVKIWD
ncbi:tail protein X [Gynuella sunshinyii]|uniref:p2-like prophage tail protein X n=1 Tax=Gynuella sunshinyii YC6258 TaxID=1445510 RepID=A0A0C5VGD3_9GAMM|nr:tail protein X [Gynuella sunshinyii]AJQ93236.1 P2-like prophage tail protein X [Gynuella sunshinyii YC6258]